ncbi:MAG: histidine kinase dimerization/phospho-acceptor domain-containing protein, partial [Pseudomonadota bacterium]
MFDTLFKQNIAVLVISIFSALALSAMLTAFFIIIPQVDRNSASITGLVTLVTTSLDKTSYSQWENLIAAANLENDFPVAIERGPPPEPRMAISLVARRLQQGLIEKNLHIPESEIIMGSDGKIWMPVDYPFNETWVTIQTLYAFVPRYGYAMAGLVGVLSALIGSLALYRQLARPLQALENHVAEFNSPLTAKELDETGPREIAAVSKALNNMSARLRQAEADRALMLAGVSHDLRTPLTKLRLSIALFKNAEPALLEGAAAQVNRIEAMLGQFLEYARGFEAEVSRDVSVSALIQDAADSTVMEGEIEIKTDQDIIVCAKPNALLRAIGNLMKNATVYGKKPIFVNAIREGDEVFIEVVDAGKGLG